MIPYSLPQEKSTLLYYADLLNDQLTRKIIENNKIQSSEEAEHLANFFWSMVDASNDKDKETGESSEYILEKIIITFMSYFRSSGYEDIWEEASDRR